MAKVFGQAGEHAGRQSVTAFKRMFATVLITSVTVAAIWGFLFASFFITRNPIGWIVVPTVAALLLWLLHYANKRVDQHETDRMAWRKGALGEYEVGAELERLSDDYTIFHNVNTTRFGNFDHIVVGSAGLFTIETKDWIGIVAPDSNGEPKANGGNSLSSHVRKFVRRTMTLREQLVALTRSDDIYVQPVMVFTKARVEAKFGDTGNVHCLRLDRLRDYIDNPTFSKKLSHEKVDQFVRALHGIAGMDPSFEAKS